MVFLSRNAQPYYEVMPLWIPTSPLEKNWIIEEIKEKFYI